MIAVWALLLGAAAMAAAPEFPALSGRVVDAANMLPPDIVRAITARAQAVEADTGAQLVVVTVPRLDGLDIADYGYQLGRHWGIGQKRESGGRGDNGVLLLVAPTERRVRIEVGYGLEPVLTDAVADTIIRRQILPDFRAGKLAEGTLAGAMAIAEVIAIPPEEWSQHQPSADRAAATDDSGGSVGGIAFFAMLGAWLWLAVSRGRRRRAHPTPRGKTAGAGKAARRRRGLPVILWGPGLWSGRDDDDHWGGFGGGGFGGGFGGGGFGGGGGSFGGGGASGGW